jgi:hypothetical protein
MSIKPITKAELRKYSKNVQMPSNEQFLGLVKRVTNRFFKYALNFVNRVNRKTSSKKFTINFILNKPDSADTSGSYATMGNTMTKADFTNLGSGNVIFNIIVNVNPLAFLRAFAWMYGPQFEHMKYDIHGFGTKSGSGFISIMWTLIHEMTHGINLHVDRNGQIYKAYEEYYKILRNNYKTDQRANLVNYLSDIRSTFPEAFRRGLDQSGTPEAIFQNVRRIMQSFSKFRLSQWYGADEGRNSSLIVRALMEHEVNVNATLFVLPVFILYMEILLDLKYKLRHNTKEYADLVEFIDGYNESHIDNPEKNTALYEVVRRLVKSCITDYTRINAFAEKLLNDKNAYEIIGNINNNIGSSYTLLTTLIDTIQLITHNERKDRLYEIDPNNLIDILIDFVSNEIAYGIYSMVKSKKHAALSYTFKRFGLDPKNINDNPFFAIIGDTDKCIADYVRESILNDYQSFIDYHKSWSRLLNLEAKLYEMSVEIIESYFNVLNDILANASTLSKMEDSDNSEKVVRRIDSIIKRLNEKLNELYKANVLVARFTATADEGYDIDLMKIASLGNYRINTDVIAIEKGSKTKAIDVSATRERVKSLLSNIFSAILPKSAQDLAEIAAEQYIIRIYNSSNSEDTIDKLGENNVNKRVSMPIIKAIRDKQSKLNISEITKYFQLNSTLNRLTSSNVLFMFIGDYEDNKVTGAAEQLINFVKQYDNDSRHIVNSMYKYVETIMDLVLFERELKNTEDDDKIGKKFRKDLDDDQNIRNHIKLRESFDYGETASAIYFMPHFVRICGFQSRYRQMVDKLFIEYHEGKGKVRSPDYAYYEYLFYTNITDSIAIGLFLPSLFEVIPVFIDNIISYDIVECSASHLERFQNFVNNIVSEWQEQQKREETKGSKEFSVLSNSWGATSDRTTLRALSNRETDDFDTLKTRPMNPKDLVFRFAIVLGATNRNVSPSCQNERNQQPPGGSGGEKRPPGGPGGEGQTPGGPGGEGQTPGGPGGEGQTPGGPGGEGQTPGGPGGEGQTPGGPGGEGQAPGGPGGEGQTPGGPGGREGTSGGNQPNVKDLLDESLEKDIDMISKVISQIDSDSSIDTQKVKDMIKGILKKVGAGDEKDVEEAYIDLMRELAKAMGDLKKKGDDPNTDILDELSKVAQRLKDKLRDIINRKRKNKDEEKEKDKKKIVLRDRDKERNWDDEVEYQDYFDPSLIIENLMSEYKKLIEKEIGKGGKGGLPEGLLVRAAFELSGLSGGALDLVFRLLSRHIHRSVFESRDDLEKSDIKNLVINVQQLTSIFKRPPLLPLRTEVTGGVILTGIRNKERIRISVPSIVADYLSIDVSGSMHGIIAEAIEAHRAAQATLQSTGNLSSNPTLSRVTDFIIRYLARKIYEHGAGQEQSDGTDKNIREALNRIVQFINDFINASRTKGNMFEVVKTAKTELDQLVKDTHEVFHHFIKDMRKEVVDSSGTSTITLAKLLNHLSSVIYMGIYSNPIDFLSANQHGLSRKKKYISVIHDGEVPRYDDEDNTYTVTSVDNYPSGVGANKSVIFPSLTDSIDIYVSKLSDNENMIKLLDFINKLRLHARNLSGGNDPAFNVGEFWARTLVKDIILSVAGHYSRGVKSAMLRIAFNVLHLTDTNYYSEGGHVAGFVNYIMGERYVNDGSNTPPYKRIIDGLLKTNSVHDVISATSDTLDPKIAKALQEIKDKMYMQTVVFENGGVAIMVNIIEQESSTSPMLTYIYFIDFVDLVVYQFEEATFESNYYELFKDDTTNILSKVDFYNKFSNILRKYGFYQKGKSSKAETSVDDLKYKRMFVQSVFSILPRSVKYYNINTASIALIYMFYSIVVLAFVGSKLRSLVKIGPSSTGVEPDYSEIDRIKLSLQKVLNDLDKYFLGDTGFRAIFDSIIGSYTKMRQGKIRIGDIFGHSLDVYASISDIGDVVEKWCKSRPDVSIEDIAEMLDGKVIREDDKTKSAIKGHGLYAYTDADANDNPMGGIIPHIPTL